MTSSSESSSSTKSPGGPEITVEEAEACRALGRSYRVEVNLPAVTLPSIEGSVVTGSVSSSQATTIAPSVQRSQTAVSERNSSASHAVSVASSADFVANESVQTTHGESVRTSNSITLVDTANQNTRSSITNPVTVAPPICKSPYPSISTLCKCKYSIF